jgi:hypothetical protein
MTRLDLSKDPVMRRRQFLGQAVKRGGSLLLGNTVIPIVVEAAVKREIPTRRKILKDTLFFGGLNGGIPSVVTALIHPDISMKRRAAFMGLGTFIGGIIPNLLQPSLGNILITGSATLGSGIAAAPAAKTFSSLIARQLKVRKPLSGRP